jgi:hypothetical protein
VVSPGSPANQAGAGGGGGGGAAGCYLICGCNGNVGWFVGGGGGGGGRGGAANSGSPGNPGNPGTTSTFNAVPVVGGTSYPITRGAATGFVNISWNPQ